MPYGKPTILESLLGWSRVTRQAWEPSGLHTRLFREDEVLRGVPWLKSTIEWSTDFQKGTLMSVHNNMGVEPKIGVPQNGWFIMENPIKMGVPWLK